MLEKGEGLSGGYAPAAGRWQEDRVQCGYTLRKLDTGPSWEGPRVALRDVPSVSPRSGLELLPPCWLRSSRSAVGMPDTSNTPWSFVFI